MNWLLLLAGTGAVLVVGGSLISTTAQIGNDPTATVEDERPDSVETLAEWCTWTGGVMVVAAMVLSYVYL